MQREIGICVGCGHDRYIINKRHNLCQVCNYFRLHGHHPGKKPIKKKRFSDKFDYCTQWGFESEISMFDAILDTRGSYSDLSGKQIPNPGPQNFAHLLAKGINKYPHFRFYPANIFIMTMQEHHLLDNGSADQRLEYATSLGRPDLWLPAYDRILKLKELYKLKFKTDGV